MKINKNQTIQFSQKIRRFDFDYDFCGFSCTGSWKLKKIELSDFWGFSCTLGHENWIESKCLIFVIFMVRKNKEIEVSRFCGFSCTRGHENWIESKCLIFVNFHVPGRGHEKWRKLKCLIFADFPVPGVMKIEENQSVWFLWIFMYLGSWKMKKIKVSGFCGFSCTWGHESWKKSNDFCAFSCTVMKVEENRSIWFLWIFMYPRS